MRLLADLQKYEALQAENMRLRDLLDSSFKIGDRVLVAELSSVDLDPYKQQVVINKGATSGVFVGQPVLDARAVMGQVIGTTPFSSTVLLITDTSHALPVQVLRNGLRTIAVGTGRIDELKLPYLPTNSDIVEGDLLVTSGLGGKFPPGYPVATVTRIDRSPDEPFSNVQAEPRAHLDRSREVLLVWTVPNQLATPDVGLATADDEVTPDAAAAALQTSEEDASAVLDQMTADGLVTAEVGTSLDQAKAILQQHRIEKLLVVNEAGENQIVVAPGANAAFDAAKKGWQRSYMKGEDNAGQVFAGHETKLRIRDFRRR